ncbi:MAG: cell surface protein, partial [Planctomycetales bacterium]|nr:cell surface protein [Planctomycetales bacterium]
MTMLRFPGRTSSLPRFLMLVVAALMCGTRPTVNAGVVDEPAREGVVKVYPSEIRLATSRDEQSFVVQVTHSNGLTGDITSEVQATLLNPTLAKIDGNRVLPLADGATELHLVWRGQTVVVPVICDQAAVDRPISFRLDVMPVFMKSGCNQGSCHGAARGKDGFRLSLFGFDPAGDYYRLTREQPGRRLNLAVPRDSLLLEKAIGAVSH